MFDLEHSTIERGQYTLCSETSRAFLLGAEICRTIYKWYSFTTVKNVFISCLRDWSPTVNTLSIDRGFEASGSKTSLLWGLRLSGSSTSRKPLPLLKKWWCGHLKFTRVWAILNIHFLFWGDFKYRKHRLRTRGLQFFQDYLLFVNHNY